MDGRDVFIGMVLIFVVATLIGALFKVDSAEKDRAEKNLGTEISDDEYGLVNSISHHFDEEVRNRLSDGKIDRREFEELEKMEHDRLDESMRKMKTKLIEKYKPVGD